MSPKEIDMMIKSKLNLLVMFGALVVGCRGTVSSVHPQGHVLEITWTTLAMSVLGW